MINGVRSAAPAIDAPVGRRRPLWWPPVLAWLGATAVVFATCLGTHWNPFAATATWGHEDARNYLAVAKGGYNLFACPGAARVWCGDAGWFPAYPWLVGGLHRLGLPLAATGVAVSWLACLGTLIILWRFFLADRPSLAGPVVALAYAAVAPGLVYDYAIFPLSLVSFCTVTSFALLQRRRLLAAGVAAAAAALAYPVGLAVAPAGLIWLLADRGAGWPDRLRRCALFGAPTLAGLGAFALDQRLATGHWDAYLLVQEKFRHSLRDPFGPVATAVRTVSHWPLVTRPTLANFYNITGAIAVQAILVFIVLVLVVADVALRRGADARADALVAIWAVLAWVLVYLTAHVDTYRGEAALQPIAIGVRRLPLALSIPIALVAVFLASSVTRLYLVVA
jgi:hypothetical protein